uniref:Uncharacterized protein n=1 Tax=Haptolina brevifila TaxID=156173 RepID=A0A7S2GMT9_9EUKA
MVDEALMTGMGGLTRFLTSAGSVPQSAPPSPCRSVGPKRLAKPGPGPARSSNERTRMPAKSVIPSDYVQSIHRNAMLSRQSPRRSLFSPALSATRSLPPRPAAPAQRPKCRSRDDGSSTPTTRSNVGGTASSGGRASPMPDALQTLIQQGDTLGSTRMCRCTPLPLADVRIRGCTKFVERSSTASCFSSEPSTPGGTTRQPTPQPTPQSTPWPIPLTSAPAGMEPEQDPLKLPPSVLGLRAEWIVWRAACERVGVGELLCECATQHHSIRALAAAIIRLHAWRGACARKDAVQLLVWCALQRRSVQALATTFDGLHKLARSRAQSMFRATMPRAPMRARHSWARWRAACEKVEASQLLGGCAMQYYSTRALGTAVERLRHHSVQCAIEATTMDRRIMRFHHARTISRGVAALQLCHEASSVRRRLLQRAARCSMRGRLIRGWAVLSARTEMLHRATQHVSRRQLNEGWIALCGGVSSGYSHQKMARNASLHAARRQLRHAWIVLSAHQWGHHLQRRIVALGYAHATRVCSGRLFHSVGRTVRGLYVWRQLTHARLRTRVLMMVVSHAAFRKRCGVALQAWRRDVLLTRREVHAAVSELGRRAWAHVLGTEHIPSLDASFKSA